MSQIVHLGAGGSLLHVPFPTGLSGRYPGVSSLMPREESRDPPSAKSSVRPNAHLCVHIIVYIHVCYIALACVLVTDDRFIMKQIKNVEISSFEQTAPLYFEHITSALDNKVHSAAGIISEQSEPS